MPRNLPLTITYDAVNHLDPGDRVTLWDARHPELTMTAVVDWNIASCRAVIVRTPLGHFLLNRDNNKDTSPGTWKRLPGTVRARLN